MADIQADIMLEQNLRVLPLYLKTARKKLFSRDLKEGFFSTDSNFKAHPYSETSPTRPQHHIMPFT